MLIYYKMSSTYIDLHNLSQIEVDEINVSNLNTDSIITTDLTVSGNLTGLTTSTSSIFNYTYTPSTRTFTLGLANQAGIDYILITDAFGVFQSVLFTPLIYPLLSGSSPILYDNTTGVFSLDTIITQNETFTGLLTATANVLSTVSQANTINNTNVSSGLYYVSLISSVGSGYKSLYNNVGISYDITTSVLTVPSIVNSGRSEFLNGNNVQGTNYSVYFGTSNSKSAQLVLWDGLAVNQYTQLYCRNNVFGVQGNITSISLEKNTFVTGTLDATTGVNIPTGQTYKINNIAQTFLNELTTTSTSTITHTFVSPNLQSNVNSLSITNAMLAGSIALSKFVIGTANQFLQTSSTLINNWVSMSGDSTLINGILTIANNAITTAKILNAAVTLAKIDTSAYSSIDTPSVLVQRDSNSNISCSTITYSAPLAPISSARIISITVPTTYPAVSTETIGYHDVLYTSLFGDAVTPGSIDPLWDRVQGLTIMEQTMYSKGILPTFKIEGQLVNFYIAPNDQVRINIAVFKNVGSTNFINVANCVNSLYVTRNLIIGSTQITPFICFFAESDATQIPGTAYTFTVCTQTGGLGVCNTGRFTNDIPSTLFVTQIY